MLLLWVMLIGAHVSPAGGPAKAVERGAEVGATVVQIFNQNPRAWKPSVYSDEQIADYYDALDGSIVESLLIHAVYLLNCASEDKEIRDKSRASLIASLQAGDRLEARGVVLHPGSALKGEIGPAIKRAGDGHPRGPQPSPSAARCTWRTRPAQAARWDAPSRSWPDCSRPPATTRAWACAWTPATCTRPASTSAPPTA